MVQELLFLRSTAHQTEINYMAVDVREVPKKHIFLMDISLLPNLVTKNNREMSMED